MKKQGSTGYECRFIMKLDRHFSDELFIEKLQNSPYIQLLERTRLCIPPFGTPSWKITDKPLASPMVIHRAKDEAIPQAVFENTINHYDESLYRFDVVHHPNHSSIVFSWHHIFMDGFGANRLLHSIENPTTAEEDVFLQEQSADGLGEQWKKLMRAKDFLRDISQEPLLKISPENASKRVKYREVIFDQTLTEALKETVKKYGRSLSDTTYFVGSIASAYAKMLGAKRLRGQDIWIPVPMEVRKAGANGPVVSNRHSLLFFRVKSSLLNDKQSLIKDLNDQLFNQVKHGMPQNYWSMIGTLRLMPTYPYYQLVKRPNGDSLAGMLYSQSPSPDNLMEFLGCKLIDATALPPSVTPPGINFQMMKFDGSTKLIVQYSESCFSGSEISSLIVELEKEILENYE